MKEVFLVETDYKSKAEMLLKTDEEINRGSIMIKEPQALGIDEKGIFIIVDLPEHLIKKAEGLLKGLGKKYKHKEKVLKKVEEEEDLAIQGFGNILG